jgi:hypothetical protein
LNLFPADSLKLREKPFPIEDTAHEQVDGPPLQLGTVTLANGERVAVIEVVRELLSNISARGIHGPIILPAVDPRCFLPEPVSSDGNPPN